MKTLFARTAIAMAVISTLSSLSFARTGPGSGNGDGDRAFALQKVAAANPGLSPRQVLLKAFEESAGRIPTFLFTAAPTSRSGNSTYSDGYISEMATQLGGEKGVEFNMFDQSAPLPSDLSNVFRFIKRLTDLGPLLTPEQSYDFVAISASLAGVVSSCNGSLCLMIGVTPWIEFRAFNNKVVLFVTHPFKDGPRTICQHISGSKSTYIGKDFKADDICTVGYFWKE